MHSPIRLTFLIALSLTFAAPFQRGGSYRLFGAGCSGSAGVPLMLGNTPTIGRSLTIRGFRIPGPTVLFFGGFNSTWNGLPLPFSLAPLGAPGCSLRVSGEAVMSGGAGYVVPIPNSPTLIGGSFYNQLVPVDRPGNALGLTTSSGARGVIGSSPGPAITVNDISSTSPMAGATVTLRGLGATGPRCCAGGLLPLGAPINREVQMLVMRVPPAASAFS